MSYCLDMLIGMPSTSITDLDEKLYLEHMRYLVAELDIKVSNCREYHTSSVKHFCYILQKWNAWNIIYSLT